MVILAWNVRGLGNRETTQALRNSIQKFQPYIVFLSETKQQRKYLEKTKVKMKLTYSYYVESDGLAGGLSLWWSKETQITILRSGKHFIDAKIFVNVKRSGLVPSSMDLTRQDEKLGSALFNPNDARVYYDFIDYTSLLELPIFGGTFTWLNQRSDEEAILEKIDRSVRLPKAVGMLDVAIGSDHAPIMILPQGLKKKYKRDFKFESKWLLEEECTTTVRASWKTLSQPIPSHRFRRKLRRKKFSLIKWSKLKAKFHNQRKQELLKRIKLYQGKQLSKMELADSKACKKEIDSMWESEERYWHPRARVDWLKFGEKNKKFFHATTLQHRRTNSIYELKKTNREWIEEPKGDSHVLTTSLPRHLLQGHNH
ncbi:hypothetical protein GQ457_01G023540 [Hibiscus cannabinus]